MALYFWYCLTLFWSPPASLATRFHLKAVILIKAASFALSALQLRSGYPPPASYTNGMGRHSFVFMHHVSLANMIGFQVSERQRPTPSIDVAAAGCLGMWAHSAGGGKQRAEIFMPMYAVMAVVPPPLPPNPQPFHTLPVGLPGVCGASLCV